MRDLLNDLTPTEVEIQHKGTFGKKHQELIASQAIKRFYQESSYKQTCDGYVILLDNKLVKTPLNHHLVVPREALAKAIMEEFSAQSEYIKPEKMPFLRIANSVIDAIAENWQILVEDLLRYVSDDMILYRAEQPEALILYEKEYWDVALEAAEDVLGVQFHLQKGIIAHKQEQHVVKAMDHYLRQKMQNFSDKEKGFAMAAFHMITSLSHSFILAIAIVERKISFEHFAECVFLEENWTMKQWGKDAEAEEKKQSRLYDLKAAVALLAMIAA